MVVCAQLQHSTCKTLAPLHEEEVICRRCIAGAGLPRVCCCLYVEEALGCFERWQAYGHPLCLSLVKPSFKEELGTQYAGVWAKHKVCIILTLLWQSLPGNTPAPLGKRRSRHLCCCSISSRCGLSFVSLCHRRADFHCMVSAMRCPTAVSPICSAAPRGRA